MASSALFRRVPLLVVVVGVGVISALAGGRNARVLLVSAQGGGRSGYSGVLLTTANDNNQDPNLQEEDVNSDVPLTAGATSPSLASSLQQRSNAAGGRGAYYNSQDGYRSNVQFGGFDQLDDFQAPPAGASTTNNLAARYENIYTAGGGRGGRASNDASLRQQQQQQQQTGGGGGRGGRSGLAATPASNIQLPTAGRTAAQIAASAAREVPSSSVRSRSGMEVTIDPVSRIGRAGRNPPPAPPAPPPAPPAPPPAPPAPPPETPAPPPQTPAPPPDTPVPTPEPPPEPTPEPTQPIINIVINNEIGSTGNVSDRFGFNCNYGELAGFGGGYGVDASSYDGSYLGGYQSGLYGGFAPCGGYGYGGDYATTTNIVAQQEGGTAVPLPQEPTTNPQDDPYIQSAAILNAYGGAYGEIENTAAATTTNETNTTDTLAPSSNLSTTALVDLLNRLRSVMFSNTTTPLLNDPMTTLTTASTAKGVSVEEKMPAEIPRTPSTNTTTTNNNTTNTSAAALP